MKVKIAVPKGHLEEQTIRLFEDSGIGVTGREGRRLFLRTSDPEVELVLVRAQDVADLVAQGATDMGITGSDLIRESGREKEVVELLDLGYGFTKLVVAAPEKSGIKSLADVKSGMRVATEFPNITGQYFSERGIEVKLTRVTGATEITPRIGVADLIVDVSSTGATLRSHGLQVIDTILESTARLIANPLSLREKRSKIEDIKTAIGSVVRARGKKLVLMNVPEESLSEIKRIMPGMAGPTVSRVEAKGLLAVQAVVPAGEVYGVVREAKKRGARDILVMPIERILP